MDTKWKKSKKTVSLLLFILGISLILESITDICRNKPSGVRIWQVDTLLEDDYQQSTRFRQYISNRLENFLIMATGGDGLGGIWGYDNGTYYGRDYCEPYYYGDYGDNYYYYDFSLQTDFIERQAVPADESANLSSAYSRELENYLARFEDLYDDYTDAMFSPDRLDDLDPQQSAEYREQLEEYRGQLEAYQNDIEAFLLDLESYLWNLEDPPYDPNVDIKPLTGEQKKKIAQKYHDNIKGDRNLLYSVSYDGQVLYSNSDLLPADGTMNAPEGYNFLLYFDGEKVHIQKDGKELDVYGNGYYTEKSEWYVPGYSNFQTTETMKKAAVCIAVAREPILYMNGSYGDGGSLQYDNGLYWMNNNLRARHDVLATSFACLCAGILLLALSLLFRKSRREALEGIARFQSKIWAEFKVLFFAAVFFGLYRLLLLETSACDWLEEIAYAYEYNSFDIISAMGQDLFRWIPSLFWILLFWSLYLLWNDLRHNRKIWQHSLTARLCGLYSSKGMNQTVSRKTARRNQWALAVSILYGLLMLGTVVMIIQSPRNSSVPGILPAFLATAGFLILYSRIGAKNMETARDVEAISRRIGEIQSGKYKIFDAAKSTTLSGDKSEERQPDTETAAAPGDRDLRNVLAQLEDISHGMANAVEEQMKSERMKVELIANVSHDIKTPLTSIISYVEFLKQEDNLPEHVKDYVRILDEKSQRLKNMVQDVFAVSKAASGELPMHMEPLDFGKLLRQTLADMEEAISSGAVTFRTQIPDTPVMILADGQRMYRVFQNLFQNAVQYSLEGSRVYVTLTVDGASATASVKNTSQQELEMGRDFVERFVRGDLSRTDGGSGLGLSIAQSFTEACGGKFFWEIDADLFVVKISFQTL